jgi:predicted GNAT family acetyltransferase
VIVFDDGSHLTEPSDEALAAKVAELGGVAEEPGPTFEVVDVTEASRFELRRDGTTVGLADYRRQGDRVLIPHVETFPEHRGQGYAARLMDGALHQIRAAGEKVVPLCPFAASHIRDNPEHQDLAA